ncbi:MAG: hypothetical protein Tsb0015_16760 [Simkaniaceae bacterium]
MKNSQQLRRINLQEHDPAWERRFQEEAKKLEGIFGEEQLAVYHIGSTAVPKIPAKPTIDILLVLKHLEAADRLAPQMEKFAYHAEGEYGIPERRFFWKEGHAFHIHVFEEGHPLIKEHLLFRNYLIAYPEEAEKYAKIKSKAAEEQKQARDYQKAKEPIIQEIMEKARRFYQEGPRPDTVHPLPAVGRKIAFLKNIITNPNIIVGDYTYYHDAKGADRFETENVLYHESILGDKLIIGKFCQIAMGTHFIMNASLHQMTGISTYPFAVFNENWAGSYPFDFPYRGNTVVGNDVWFGYKSCIMPGLKIGDGAIIGSRALVTKDVPPYAIVGGNPAKIIRMRFSEEKIKKLQEIRWWDWPIEVILKHLTEITGGDVEKLEKITAEFPS